jgi:hypothetical protein
MSKFTKFALAGMMATALGALQARAEGPTPAPKADKPVTTTAPLTDESLLTMLQNMGYDPKIDKVEKTSIYTLKIDQDKWTYTIDVALSGDKDQLWITSSAADFPADGKVPAEKLLQLLEETNTIGPAAVYTDKQHKNIKVSLPLLNHGGVTPAVFRTYLSDYVRDLADVQKLCDFGTVDAKADDKGADKK